MFYDKKTLLQCFMSSESKIRGALAKIKVDREVHYNNKGVQHPSKIARREHLIVLDARLVVQNSFHSKVYL